ncbi:MAG: hypothetical protein RID53_09310 [Coleofasciculus sp. B1-GNL1-01]
MNKFTLTFVIGHLDRAGLVTLGWVKNDSSETRPYNSPISR